MSEENNKPFSLPYENSHGDSTLKMVQTKEDEVRVTITDEFTDSLHEATMSLEEAKKLHAEFEDMEGEMQYQPDSMHMKYFPDLVS